MKVQEYLDQVEWSEVSFIIAKAATSENTSHVHAEYRTSMLYHKHDDLHHAEYLILNTDVMPLDWLSGAAWGNAVKQGRGKCLLIVSWEEITKLYSEKQARNTIQYIDLKIRRQMEADKIWQSMN